MDQQSEIEAPLPTVRESFFSRFLTGFRKKPVYRTKTGRILTDADIQALADEAERGYDVEQLLQKRGA